VAKGNFIEPPGADPHAGWCGWERKKLPLTRLAPRFLLLSCIKGCYAFGGVVENNNPFSG